MIWINGQPQEHLSVRDRAVQFGDGCFTTARIEQGEVFDLRAHLERLQQACERLLIRDVDWQALRQEMKIAAATRTTGVLKVIVSRGVGGRGYSASGCQQASRIIMLSDYPTHYHQLRQTGVRLALSTIRLGRNPQLAGIKHLNRLEQVLIRTELEQTGADEALVLDTQGLLVECCAANLFWRKGEEVFTPDVTQAGVNGIQRQRVMRLLAAQGVRVREVSVPPQILEQADEIFITNALMPVLPVVEIDNRFYRSRTLFNRINEHDFQGNL
ncbi:4-amino-4-deoxychorismate lyase [Erwinia persicina]|jgi:4-amino-4-deoxychorismate lyase|uniref:Aminodeoxychorismate lyase n=1 Tax=Erwinia plantamica TaxID=3237104 RepID=A0ABW7CR08_9GAMM|nr:MULTISPECIES: aminodeoxychorismate lyase [Erwinia]MCP1437345.1 4-amino-4-deoxychorismate lyase [Erwinia persicina]MDN4628602.1 aminodeoxychorismate lyase [Erwinia sp. PsM31]MDN8540716.1 aminodeoxychorismate lyase [Erwinia sp. BC051422]